MASGNMSGSRDGPDYGPGRKNQYFVPGEGIAREVITADICKYLDNDATVRPFNYQVKPLITSLAIRSYQ